MLTTGFCSPDLPVSSRQLQCCLVASYAYGWVLGPFSSVLEEEPALVVVVLLMGHKLPTQLLLKAAEKKNSRRHTLLPLSALTPQWALPIWHPALLNYNQSSGEAAGGPPATQIPGTYLTGQGAKSSSPAQCNFLKKPANTISLRGLRLYCTM